MQESQTLKLLEEVELGLGPEEIAKINLLIQYAHKKLLESVAYKYIEELLSPSKLEAATPIEILNSLSKIIRMLKDLPDSGLSTKLKSALSGNVSLETIKNPEPLCALDSGQKPSEIGGSSDF